MGVNIGRTLSALKVVSSGEKGGSWEGRDAGPPFLRNLVVLFAFLKLCTNVTLIEITTLKTKCHFHVFVHTQGLSLGNTQ